MKQIKNDTGIIEVGSYDDLEEERYVSLTDIDAFTGTDSVCLDWDKIPVAIAYLFLEYLGFIWRKIWMK